MAATVGLELGAWDYVTFGTMLCVSSGIGVYFALSGTKQKSTGEYLMANRNMMLIPVAISMLVSFLSAILILGGSAEMFTAGTQYYLYMIGQSIACVLAAVLFAPLIYPLKVVSAYEYLELRFNSRAAKLTGTIIMIVQQILYMGIASFAPSTALEAVTGFPVWATIITVGSVATFYTFLGGMKAVVMTDVFQCFVMIAGILAIIIQGAIKVGGMDTVWEINTEWNRTVFFDFNTDPTQRHSFWSLIIGGAIGWTATYGVNQASVQRYSALPTLKKARMSLLLNIIGVFIFVTATCLAGVAVFAYYAQKGCDPLSAGLISNSNQIVPYFVMEVLGYPGVPGLFIASLFSGALSSVSSSLNALAAVVWEDFLKIHLAHRLSDSQQAWVTRFLVVFFGAAGIGMAFMAEGLGGTVLEASLSFTGASSGPILGLFVLGAFFPWANWLGAVFGGAIGLAFPLWISIGAYSSSFPSDKLPLPSYNCNITDVINATTAAPLLEPVGIQHLYTVSYLWYPAIGATTTVVIGLIISFITGHTKPRDVDPKYLIPIFERFFCCLPESIRGPLRCGLEFQTPEEIEEEVEKRRCQDSGEMLNGYPDKAKSYNLATVEQLPNGYVAYRG